MISVLGIILYQILTGLEEGCDNLAPHRHIRWYHSQKWYHRWRFYQGLSIIFVLAPGVLLDALMAAHGLAGNWHFLPILKVCLFLQIKYLLSWGSGNGIYNKVLWFVADGSWNYNSWNGSPWAITHRWVWVDWVMFGGCGALSLTMAFIK